MPQLTLVFYTPSNEEIARLRRWIAMHEDAVSILPTVQQAFKQASELIQRPDNWLEIHHAYFDAKNLVDHSREAIREGVYACETGHPGRNVWNEALEEFGAILARARELL
jgi:hypothetical protein